MLQPLAKYADCEDEAVPGHKTKPRSHNLWIARLGPDRTEVVETNRRFYLPSLNSGRSPLPAVGCDSVKDVAGVRKEKYRPSSENWRDTDMAEGYRERLDNAIAEADGRLNDTLKLLRNRRQAVLEELEERAEYKDSVVFVDDVHGDNEPLAQEDGAWPTPLQEELQEVNFKLFLKTCTADKEGQCGCCGEVRPLADKFPGRYIPFPSKNQPAFLKGKKESASSLHVCARCAAEAVAAWNAIEDAGNDLRLRGGVEWAFFSASTDASLYAKRLRGDLDENAAETVNDQLYGGQPSEEGPSGKVNVVAVGTSETSRQRSDFWHAEQKGAAKLWASLSKWHKYQDTGISEPIPIKMHLENLAHSPTESADGPVGSKKTRLYGSAKDLPNRLLHHVPKVAIQGRRLPSSFLTPILSRLRSSSPEVRAYDLTKPVLQTNLWSTAKNKQSNAYKLGSLLSVADEVYWRIDEEDYKMSDRYFAKLYSEPSLAAGRLVEDVRTRLSQLNNKNRPSRDLDKKFWGLVSSIEDPPRSLSPSQQSQFALGYAQAREQRFNGGNESSS
jgi:hypothetical protein